MKRSRRKMATAAVGAIKIKGPRGLMTDVIGYKTVIRIHSCWLGFSHVLPSQKDMANVNLKVGKRINRTFDIKAVVNVFELMEQRCV